MHNSLQRSLLPSLLILGILFQCTESEPTPAPVNSDRFIQKSFLDLYGRQASAKELADQTAIIQSSGRSQYLLLLQETQEYTQSFYQDWVIRLFPNNPDVDLFYAQEIAITEASMGAQLLIDMLESEKQGIPAIPSELFTNSITHAVAIRRIVESFIFERENMGAINYSRGLFEFLLGRTPDPYEEEQSAGMLENWFQQQCDEASAPEYHLFTQSGNCRDDLLDILFDHYLYDQFQSESEFIRLLARNPTETEKADYAMMYRNTDDFRLIQRTLMLTSDYSS